MKKEAGWIVGIAVAVSLAYLLITEQIDIAREIIPYVMLIICFALAGMIYERNRKRREEKLIQEYLETHPEEKEMLKNLFPMVAEDDAAAVASRTFVRGVVRPAADFRGTITWLISVLWLCLLILMAAAWVDGSFVEPETVAGFGILAAGLFLFSVLMCWLMNKYMYELYYSVYGVVVKSGRKQKNYSWKEIGGFQQMNYRYVFLDPEGKRLFSTNCSYEGFDGFMTQYRKTHGNAV